MHAHLRTGREWFGPYGPVLIHDLDHDADFIKLDVPALSAIITVWSIDQFLASHDPIPVSLLAA